MKLVMLPRLVVFLIVLDACMLYTKSDGTETLDQIYAEADSKNITYDSLKCEGIEGRVTECSECYTCDHEAVARHRTSKHEITHLKLNDANCAASETICCVSQKDLKFRESTNVDRLSCGHSNPEGYPRALRSSIRSVLQGEYPWRAWIYYWQDPETPLCAATYINKEGRTLLTSASCVEGRRADALIVRFTRDPQHYDPVHVSRIDVHELYNKDTQVNDIAVLSVESVPSWMQKVCLPIQPVLLGTSCIAVSDNNFYLNQVVPRQTKCKENGSLDDSLMCSATLKDDYTPELGGGMFCVDEQSSANTYTVYGVYLASANNGLAVLNTNVTHFTEWIIKKAEKHINLIRNSS
ncbi:complement factor I-like [Maniola jurtina]|uniref:complement factor I-like n=1 Tax=Maniola jurtina TaxID=191418 RepID=UPI001E68BB36|nr:complement factor I-like [Maniola jurtina]